jgi:hypothetical protein
MKPAENPPATFSARDTTNAYCSTPRIKEQTNLLMIFRVMQHNLPEPRKEKSEPCGLSPGNSKYKTYRRSSRWWNEPIVDYNNGN